jgi:hypothetical protein
MGFICPCHTIMDSKESPIDVNNKDVAFIII